MNYVLAVLTDFNVGAEEVTLKARGRALSHAVDVAEVARSRFLEGVKVGKIEIGTEEIEEENRTRNVSTMEITLTRSKPKPKVKPKRKRRQKEKKE
jgi:DNA-binding protein